MQHAHDDRVEAVRSSANAESRAGLALAGKGWTVVDGARGRSQPGMPGLEDEGPWRAAERALAEIAAVNRDTFANGGNERLGLERAIAAARDSLLEAAQGAAEASRRARALAERLDQALAGMHAAHPVTGRAMGADASRLSEREREVLAHIAAGRSNKAIAEALFVSPNTVKTHVASLLRKLDAHSRAQLATIAVQYGLRQGAAEG